MNNVTWHLGGKGMILLFVSHVISYEMEHGEKKYVQRDFQQVHSIHRSRSVKLIRHSYKLIQGCSQTTSR